jgi:phosphate starvation-inducible membrane PsiE
MLTGILIFIIFLSYIFLIVKVLDESHKRHIGIGLAFVACIFLTPVIGWFLTYNSQRLDARGCLFCGNIENEAEYCKICGNSELGQQK